MERDDEFLQVRIATGCRHICERTLCFRRAYIRTTFLVSEDGISWKRSDFPLSIYPHGIAFGNGAFVAVGWGENTVFLSQDGENWHPIEVPATEPIQGIAFGNGKFVAVGGMGHRVRPRPIPSRTVLISATGTDWEADTTKREALNSIIFASDTFIALADYGRILTSFDGKDWAIVYEPKYFGPTLWSIAPSGKSLVSVGEFGQILQAQNS